MNDVPVALESTWRTEDGARLASTVWRAGGGWRAISSAMVGGGIGPVRWVLNAQVPGGYSRTDPVAHLDELAASHGLAGPGVGMLTAAAVERDGAGRGRRRRGGGDRGPAGPDVGGGAGGRARPRTGTDAPRRPRPRPRGETATWRPGTINVLAVVPVPLTDAALVNAVVTVTEAKTQALLEAGFPCTGTASDAVCVAVPEAGTPEPFAGPRSVWGSRLARAVHEAVHAGAVGYAALLAERG
ncbi:adenosylcobinamide amidohydrolase [Actinomadura sp. CNU-125]|uniref:adenosylcobinamide amidohydrolase n=1 Tax=Actinomadura sp. CNU-125 TaxID=1904961 RepID=UPI00096A7E35|nr:adenosylcobinamide amidohydrolase [Actinomadura sp. CNU-125]